MKFRTMRENELESFVSHCCEVFGDIPSDFFRDHYLLDPNRDTEAMFVAEENGAIASFTQVFSREMYLSGQPVRVGAIGDVTTKKEYRGRGLNRRLIGMAIEYMQDKDIPVSMLYTDIPDYYRQYGWFTVTQRHIPCDLTQVDPLPEGYELVPFTEADLPDMQVLYHLTAFQLDGAYVRREKGYWTHWVPHYLKNARMLKLNGHLVAWMDVDVQGDILALVDYAGQPVKDWFLPMLAAHGRDVQITKAKIPSPLMPESNGPFVEYGRNMYRLNQPFQLGQKKIDTPGKLAAALSDSLFWDTDIY